MPKEKLTPSETSILKLLIFPEEFRYIQEETEMSFGAIRDDLMKLKNHGYVEVFESSSSPSSTPFYDSDNIDQFSFKATRMGLKRIQNHAI